MLLKLKKAIDKVLGGSVAILMAILLVDVVWQVFSRYILKDPSSFTDELARYLLIWVSLLGAAYVTGQRMHLAIDLLPSKINNLWLERFIYLCIAAFAFLALVIGGSQLVDITLTLDQRSSSLQWPLGYVYLALPISGILIMTYSFIELFTISSESN